MQIIHSHQVELVADLVEARERIESISEDRLREWVTRVAEARHFEAEAEKNREIGEWISTELASFGYEIERQGVSENIIARPSGRFEEVIVVGAHYDSVPGSPGADDNGSAVAAMIGCAAALVGNAPQFPIVFAAFNREEDGFIGSGEFVDLTEESMRIRCAHILEMVGYASDVPGSQRLPTGLPIHLPEAGNFLGLLANGKSAATMRSILRHGRTFVPELPVTGLKVLPGAERVFPVLARSDHVPFWARNIPAVMWTDTAEFRNPHYHRVSDTPETLNYGFLKRVTMLLTVAVMAQAGEIQRSR